jgi:hypothetical protein
MALLIESTGITDEGWQFPIGDVGDESHTRNRATRATPAAFKSLDSVRNSVLMCRYTGKEVVE